MLQQNFYPGKAIQVWGAGDGGTSSALDANVPNPSYWVEEMGGITTANGNAILVDASATFLDDLSANKFAIGDTVYQPKLFKHSRIVSVDSQTQLTVVDATFFPSPFALGVSYEIYRASNEGCVVWIFNDRATNTPIADLTDLNGTYHPLLYAGAGNTMIPFQCEKYIHPSGVVAPNNYAFAMFQ